MPIYFWASHLHKMFGFESNETFNYGFNNTSKKIYFYTWSVRS